VVAPTTANGRQPALKSNRRRAAAPTTNRIAPAISARRVTAPIQPNAWTALSSARNENPQMMESST
jgi:hypothetical protein